MARLILPLSRLYKNNEKVTLNTGTFRKLVLVFTNRQYVRHPVDREQQQQTSATIRTLWCKNDAILIDVPWRRKQCAAEPGPRDENKVTERPHLMHFNMHPQKKKKQQHPNEIFSL